MEVLDVHPSDWIICTKWIIHTPAVKGNTFIESQVGIITNIYTYISKLHTQNLKFCIDRKSFILKIPIDYCKTGST